MKSLEGVFMRVWVGWDGMECTPNSRYCRNGRKKENQSVARITHILSGFDLIVTITEKLQKHKFHINGFSLVMFMYLSLSSISWSSLISALAQ